MANLFSHTRTRARTYEYAKLDQASLKRYSKTPVGTSQNLTWHNHGRKTLEIHAQRKEQSLFVYTDQAHGYHIHFVKTKLTFGYRYWYLCPACNRRCAILYHAKHFACRQCVKPTYESQNGSKIDHCSQRIRNKRHKLWPGTTEYLLDDLMETCEWWPKPKGLHREKFEREKAKIIQLERQHFALIPQC